MKMNLIVQNCKKKEKFWEELIVTFLLVYILLYTTRTYRKYGVQQLLNAMWRDAWIPK
jgi:hypothetical protein